MKRLTLLSHKLATHFKKMLIKNIPKIEDNKSDNSDKSDTNDESNDEYGIIEISQLVHHLLK